MKKKRVSKGLKGRKFNGLPYPKLKLVHKEPRSKLRHQLRSSIPFFHSHCSEIKDIDTS